jgi:metallophosphoesterase superfamily enzyme
MLNRAYLVVGVHDADESRLGPNGALNLSRVDHAGLVHGHDGFRKAKALYKLLQCVPNGVVLDG